MVRRDDNTLIERTHNVARFFTENAHVSWVLLVALVFWGAYSYVAMPQRKDPEITIRTAVVVTPWPGAAAIDVEELLTRRIESRLAENAAVAEIESISRSGLSIVYVQVGEDVEDIAGEFDDLNLRLGSLDNLPDGAGPIHFIKDFGDTAALMLTVASPKAGEIEIELRARALRQAVERVRVASRQEALDAEGFDRVTMAYFFAQSVSPEAVRSRQRLAARFIEEGGFGRDIHLIDGPGFIGWDFSTGFDDEVLLRSTQRFISERLQASELHPDSWGAIILRDPDDAEDRVAAIAGDKYSYRELDDFTDVIAKAFLAMPMVSKVTRSGVLEERIYLEYSQERLASYGIPPMSLRDILSARSITLPGGVLEVEEKNITIDPSGEFKTESDIGEVLVSGFRGRFGSTAPELRPLYMRDLGTIVRGYDSPARFLNYYLWRGEDGEWQRRRAITLAVQMRSREQIRDFGLALDAALEEVRARLPEDLVLARTSDQPRQVTESIDQFMANLYQAIGLVVLVALVGFRQWRPTAIIALSIPLSVGLSFGFMNLLGIDLQQVSIASLIIALGLLVDDPIVATDSIQSEIARGHEPSVAGWLGPTKLAKPMYFTTVTNIVAYLPFLLLTGDKGRFLVSLPIVLACTLIASRLIAMTYVPFLGAKLLRPIAGSAASLEERRRSGLSGLYYRVGRFALGHRKRLLASSLLILLLGGFFVTQLKSMFFPKDFSYLSYVNIWMPEDAPLSSTERAARVAERVIQETAAGFDAAGTSAVSPEDGLLESITTFLGGGGPRFWFSVAPEIQQLNYAQLIVRVRDKTMTRHLVAPLQRALASEVPGALVDVRELETGEPVGIPIEIRLSGEDVPTLRELAEEVKEIFRAEPLADRVRDDWGAESFAVNLRVDPDRANLVGISNLDVALSSLYGTVGFHLTNLREGDKNIPVVARLRMEERSQLSDIQNLYVYSLDGPQRVPLGQISSVEYDMKTEKIRRRNQFRAITVGCFPVPGTLPSEVMDAVRDELVAVAARLPPGYRMEIAGEEEKQVRGLREIAVIMALSALAIYLALLIQTRHAIKPIVLFAAIPYGMVGALGLLWLTDSPLGFMALLGLTSLIGLITSQVIVLFDAVEVMREEGASLFDALLDSGITRMRPVLISVSSTVLGLLPLALRGGPLWEPLTYAQIGGLTVSAFIILLGVPLLYATFVLDLKLVRWEAEP